MSRLLVLALCSLAAPVSAQFSYTPPGELESPGGGATRPGAGRADDTVYAPGMRFPLESAPAFLNSQIYGHGGYMGPGGGQCTGANYDFPWHDNYCEERSWDMPLCPSGRGHQGQDIRPGTCDDSTHWAVAAADGTITNVGSYSVYLTADDGTRYDYLHMDMSRLAVTRGQRVSRGDRLGLVSNDFGGTSTTIHLHFNIRKNVSGVGSVYAPTYMSLVRSYEELTGESSEPDWRAEFVDQSFPLASMPFELAPGAESPGYIEMRNTGAEAWRPGEVFLGTTEPRDVDSPLAGPDWSNPHRAATVDAITEPGEVGRFSFTVRAPSAAGEYAQHFNLVREGVSWFSESGGPADGQLQVRVTVVAESCGEVGPAWTCETGARVRCLDGSLERESCASACRDGACVDEPGGPLDEDGDGHNTSVDCDDSDPDVYPGAFDACGDGRDMNCDGVDPMCPEPGTDGGSAFTPDAGSGTGPTTRETRTIAGGCRAGGSGDLGWSVLLFLALFRRRR